MNTLFSRILGVGDYLPKRTVPNSELETFLDTSDSWIRERTGIESRSIAEPEESASSMGAIAAQRALEQALISKDKVDLIIVATATPDALFPATACLIQAALDIPVCIAFDIQAACSGFVYALSVADQFIKNGTVRYALVIGSELMTRMVDWTDRSTCVLFGDGAGAVVLGVSKTPGIECFKLCASGQEANMLEVQHWHGTAPELRSQTNFYLQMDGRRLFKFMVNALSTLILKLLDARALSVSDIDWLIPHQANKRILTALAEKTGIPTEKMLCTIEKHSNTSSASIPLAMSCALKEGLIHSGQRLLLVGFGGGATWGAVLLQL